MSPSEIAALVAYDASTGELTWKHRGIPRFDNKLFGKPACSQPSNGYLTGRIGGVNYKAHRVAWALHYGVWPNGWIDHINGNRSDNRIVNLRVVDALQNAKNSRLGKANTSGEIGISWFARDSKWWVKIGANRHQHHIGYFDSLEEAIAARDEAHKRFGFHENHGH